MTATRAAVIQQLADSLLDAKTIFGADATAQNVAFGRHVDTAVADMNRVLPRVLRGQLTLQAGTTDYDAPADALRVHEVEAVALANCIDPWDLVQPLQIPIPKLYREDSTPKWVFWPAPSAGYIGLIGSTYRYSYIARHVLPDTGTSSIFDELVPLVVVRAQVEALRELAIRNAHKPMQTRDGLYNQTRNGTPAALADLCMKMFETQARVTAETYKALS